MSDGFTIAELKNAMITKSRSFRAIPGGVVSDRVTQLLRDAEHSEAIAEDILYMLAYYNGFLVCESCPGPMAERIAAALNFVEGLSTEYLQTRRMKELLPDLRDEEVNVLPMVM